MTDHSHSHVGPGLVSEPGPWRRLAVDTSPVDVEIQTIEELAGGTRATLEFFSEHRELHQPGRNWECELCPLIERLEGALARLEQNVRAGLVRLS